MVLLRSIATVGGMTMVSRVFGFLRDILIAGTLGAGPVADAFFVAFRFPNLFRSLFAEGAFTAAFVPIFAGILESEGRARAVAFAQQAFSVLLWILLLFVVVVEMAMPLAITVLAPGFRTDPEKFDLAVTLSRIVFPYLLFVSLVALLAGVLNSLGKFAAAAAAPILLNLCMIAALLWLEPYAQTAGHALAWGVAVAGLVQFVWLWVVCARAGVPVRLPRPRLSPEVRTLLRRALPVALGAGIYQVNMMVNTMLASLLPVGAVSYLFYADRIHQLPIGVVGVAVGTALLPLMSRQLRAGHLAAAHHSQNRALEFSLLLTLPAATAMIVIAEPIIAALFQRGAFDAADARATASTLMALALGLPAYMLVKSLTPGYFARHDTRTPVKIAACTVMLNIALSLVLMGPLLYVGIALATSISAWANAIALAVILHRRGFLQFDARLSRRLPRTLAATAVMAGTLALVQWGLIDWLAGDQHHRVAALVLLVVSGLGSFALSAQLFGAAVWADIRALRRS
jgi:putative peptidoglycan lipid II flippase